MRRCSSRVPGAIIASGLLALIVVGTTCLVVIGHGHRAGLVWKARTRSVMEIECLCEALGPSSPDELTSARSSVVISSGIPASYERRRQAQIVVRVYGRTVVAESEWPDGRYSASAVSEISQMMKRALRSVAVTCGRGLETLECTGPDAPYKNHCAGGEI